MKKFVRNKSKVGIWTRIKNIFNNSPWHAAFSYPFVFLFFFIIITILIEYLFEYLGFNELLVTIYLGKIIFLIPIWILVGLIVSKRRFPYVVTLFIFVGLPLLGMLATSGYEKAAKVSATKTIHAQTVKYISGELNRCTQNETSIMNNTVMCSEINSTNVIQAALNLLKDKNPHNPDFPKSARSSDSNTNDEDVGYVSLSSSGSNIIIKSCNKTPCKKEENRKQSTVSVK